MEFDQIIAISGQSSLFLVANRTNFGMIAESVEDGKKIPVYAHYTVSKLDDISIYTDKGDVPLREVMLKIFEKLEGKSVDGVVSNDDYRAFFETVLPDYDKERVYISDIKKLVKWYNQLTGKGLVDAESLKKAEAEPDEKDDKEKDKKSETKKKTTAKTTTKSKTTAIKNAPNKKVQTVRKSGSS